jgi:hypothetical protein
MKVFSYLKNRTGFLQGLAVGLVLTSTISYAVVSLTTFSSGTPISSSAMNSNFSTIKSKLDELDVGFIGIISSNYLVTCVAGTSSAMYPADYTDLVITPDYNDGNFAGNVYTIPSTGLYRIYFYAKSEDMMGYNGTLDISTDSGATWSQQIYGGMSEQNSVKKFTAGTKIKVSVGCGNMAGADSTVDAASFMIAIKKF